MDVASLVSQMIRYTLYALPLLIVLLVLWLRSSTKRRTPGPAQPGYITKTPDPWQDASAIRDRAHRLLPKLLKTAQASMLLCAIIALACAAAIWLRAPPLVLLSYPDGTTRCAQPPLDPATGATLHRTPNAAQICAMLENSNDDVTAVSTGEDR